MKSTTFIQVQCFSSENETTNYASLPCDGYSKFNKKPNYGIEEAREHIKEAIQHDIDYAEKWKTNYKKTVYKIVCVTRTEEIIESY